MTVATIHIKDEINIIVKGLTISDYTELSNIFAVYAKGFRYQAKFKLGHWDGKVRFCDKVGKTYVRLIPEILDFLRIRDYTVKLVDDRIKYNLTIQPIDNQYFQKRGIDITLGDHQVRGINALLSEAGGIFEGGTGSGKTLMAAVLALLYEEKRKLRTIIIVPTSDLIDQTFEELSRFGVDVGVYGGTKKDINHKHLISTWQSLQNNKGLIGQYHVAIVDECHGVSGLVLQEILNKHGARCRVRIGLTGTLPEEDIDKMAVRVTMGDVVEGVEVAELIESGWLAELHLYCYSLIEDLRAEYHQFCEENPEEASKLTYRKFKSEYFKDYTAEKRYIQKRPERLKMLANLIAKPPGNTLVLVPNIAFGRAITKLIPNAIFFYGADSRAIRKELYKSFEEKDDIIAITTYSLGSTGLNIKRIFNLFLIDPGKSYVQVIQSIGRGLRKAYDKVRVNVYDIHSDLKFSRRHASIRKRHYKNKKYPYKEAKVDYMELIGEV